MDQIFRISIYNSDFLRINETSLGQVKNPKLTCGKPGRETAAPIADPFLAKNPRLVFIHLLSFVELAASTISPALS